MKRVIPEIHVKQCKDAISYYQSIFGGEIKNIQTSDNKEMFKGHEGKIIHAELHLNESTVLYFVDLFDEGAEDNNINLVLEMEDMDEIERIYKSLSSEGTTRFPLQKTFWGAYHAVVTDKNKLTWGLNLAIK